MTSPARKQFEHAAVAALTCLITVQALGQTARAPTVTIRSFGPVPKVVQSLLTEYGQSESVDVASGADPFVIVRSRCGGSITNDYIDDLKRLNPGFLLGRAAMDRRIELPPCVRVAKNVQVKVLPGDESVDSITRRLLGVPAHQNIPVCDITNNNAGPFNSCKLNAGLALNAINGGKLFESMDFYLGKKITAPTVTWPTTIVLKPGVDAGAIAERITAAVSADAKLRPGVVVAEVGGDVRIIAPLASNDPKIVGTACAPASAVSAASPVWPIDVGAMTTRLAASKEAATARKLLGGPAVIRVADTGFDGIGKLFPLSLIEVNSFDRAGQPFDLDNNGHIADVFGIDAENRGDLEPYPDDPYRDHGTAVASMALGGRSMHDATVGTASLVKLSFAKIYWRRPGPIGVKEATIYETMSHIENHSDARVVNLSVGSVDGNSLRMFVPTLSAAASLNLLVVVAAGNASADISTTPTYPAVHGGRGSPVADRVITVGALAPDGTLAKFSNFSKSRVDILAPGCRIPFAVDGSSKLLHGTSMAAPIVSYVAGTLHSLGIREMRRVKQRILVSADYDRSLERYTRLGGLKLNPVRAISIFDDVIRIRGDDFDRYWLWRYPAGAMQVCSSGLTIDPRRLLSLSTYTEGGRTRVRILKAEFDSLISDPIDCEAADIRLNFFNEAGESKPVELRNVSVLVPRYPFAGG